MNAKSLFVILLLGVGGFLAYKTWFNGPEASLPPGVVSSPTTTATANPSVVKAGPGEKDCFACNATGQLPCRARCQKGQTICPGPCLKLSQGTWERQNVPGHSPNELWRRFPYGKGGSKSWNQGHVGEVITYENGEPVNVGKCTTCGGTTKVNCTACAGTGLMQCNICDGKRFVPEAWSATDNPKIKTRPVAVDLKTIRLKDGSTIQGKISGRMSDTTWITTSEGKLIKVSSDDIVPDSK